MSYSEMERLKKEYGMGEEGKSDAEILKQRALEYGDANKSFSDIARMWSLYIEYPIEPHQVAIMMTLLKIHRGKTAKGFHFKDSMQDGRNYLTLAEQLQEDGL